MQAPLIQMFIKGFQTLVSKLIGEVLVSSLTTLLVMIVVSHVSRPTPTLATPKDETRLSTEASALPQTAEAGEKAEEFLQRVALSHVASLHSQPRSSSDANETVAEAGMAPHPVAEPKRERTGQSKNNHLAANLPKIQPPVKPTETAAIPPTASEPQAAPPLPATSAAALPAKEATNAPLAFGMGLVNQIGTILSDSKTHVFETVASAGNSIT
ncbi:MAG: DUF1631 domain-containing protein, partial [Alphaproteobacteria bacterium]|nr:DUF1631 domain-containing protein [Alphaproteobacteria bacterium]